jgi:hypothetical protein
MNNAVTNEDEDKPLDPAMEKVRRKMVRLLVISIGIMMAGVMALLFAIVYKINNKSTAPAVSSNVSVPQGSDEITGTIALPDGAQINSHSLSGNQILLDLTLADGSRELALFDMGQGRIVAHYKLTNVK